MTVNELIDELLILRMRYNIGDWPVQMPDEEPIVSVSIGSAAVFVSDRTGNEDEEEG
jgi:hypothetical protein